MDALLCCPLRSDLRGGTTPATDAATAAMDRASRAPVAAPHAAREAARLRGARRCPGVRVRDETPGRVAYRGLFYVLAKGEARLA